MPKACKNATEIAGIRKAHHRDGIALCRFLAWLDEEVSAGRPHDEGRLRSIGSLSPRTARIERLVLRNNLSSGPQCCNGPLLAHQRNPGITDDGLRVLGGQRRPVPDGTTDVTAPSLSETQPPSTKRCSPGLKGHIALARAQFPHGVGGNQLDILARQFLWEIGKDYDHGTGHGVGCYLSVHEGPQRIGKTPGPTPALRPGMVVSNEPGYYEPNAYGIRCENSWSSSRMIMACCHLSR